jgi:hypothetical protein
MDQISFPQYSFAMLLEPAVVLAAAERAAKWKLPRHICRPLDRRVVVPISADVAAFDATVDDLPIDEA